MKHSIFMKYFNSIDILILSGLLFLPSIGISQQIVDSTEHIVLPKLVLETLINRFPDAVIVKQTRESEEGKMIYDIEFTIDGNKYEADVFEDGVIHNWEKAIQKSDLPSAVIHSVEKKYPKATFRGVMAMTSVNDGNESLEGYEIVLIAKDLNEYEVTVTPSGQIVEDSGDTQ